jgi:hypothetical protein
VTFPTSVFPVSVGATIRLLKEESGWKLFNTIASIKKESEKSNENKGVTHQPVLPPIGLIG